MLDPKKNAEIDQGIQGMVEILPPLMKGLFDGFVEKGFTEVQALELTKVSCFAQMGGKVVSG